MSLSEDKKQDQRIESVKTAHELSKHLIMLATGTIILSGTFIKDIANGSVSDMTFLLASWISMAISILFGVLLSGSLIYSLSSKQGEDLDPYQGNYKGVIQSSAFLLGIILFIYFIKENSSF